MSRRPRRRRERRSRRSASGSRRPPRLVVALLLVAAGLWALRTARQLLPPRPSPTESTSIALPRGDAARLPSGSVRRFRSRVADVVDGDSVRLADGSELRYLGIDTPELDDPLHDQATRRNRQLVTGGEVTIVVPTDTPADRYGRRLGVVYPEREATDAGDVVDATTSLLRAGLGHVYLKGDDAVSRALARRWIAVQNEAIDRRLGLWSLPGRLRESPRGALRATRHRFHRRDCRHLRQPEELKPTSREAAYRAGRSPCRTCRPQ